MTVDDKNADEQHAIEASALTDLPRVAAYLNTIGASLKDGHIAMLAERLRDLDHRGATAAEKAAVLGVTERYIRSLFPENPRSVYGQRRHDPIVCIRSALGELGGEASVDDLAAATGIAKTKLTLHAKEGVRRGVLVKTRRGRRTAYRDTGAPLSHPMVKSAEDRLRQLRAVVAIARHANAEGVAFEWSGELTAGGADLMRRAISDGEPRRVLTASLVALDAETELRRGGERSADYNYGVVMAFGPDRGNAGLDSVVDSLADDGGDEVTHLPIRAVLDAPTTRAARRQLRKNFKALLERTILEALKIEGKEKIMYRFVVLDASLNARRGTHFSLGKAVASIVAVGTLALGITGWTPETDLRTSRVVEVGRLDRTTCPPLDCAPSTPEMPTMRVVEVG